MPLRWTEFPETVEQFGNLISIYETLDQHEVFDFECFPDHPEKAAYEVKRHRGQWVIVPRPERMPGLDRLLERLEREGHYTLTLDLLRDLRRQIVDALKCDRATANAMTFHQIADALDRADNPPAPSPSSVNSLADRIKTFGDMIADVRAVELCVAYTRAEAQAMGGEPGSASVRIQAGVIEATAAYKQHPTFPLLEAYVNQHYGDFTHANLLFVRGDLCSARNCGSTVADQLPLEEAVVILRCPGAGLPQDLPPSAPAATPPLPPPPGVAADLDSVTWNLSNIFRLAVDLAVALDGEHDWVSIGGEPDQICFQLRRALNPRDWPLRFTFQSGRDGQLLPGWLESIGMAACLCADTKRALESLALIACDIDGVIESFPTEPDEDEESQSCYAVALENSRRWLQYARSLLAPSSAALWVVMTEEEHARVADHGQAKARRQFGWAEMPTELPTGLQCYHDGGRTLDDGGPEREYRLWRTFALHTIPDVEPPATRTITPKPAGEHTLSASQPESRDLHAAAEYGFALVGQSYRLIGFGETGYLPASLLGLEAIAKLLRRPGVPVPWAELDPALLHDAPRTAQPAQDEMGLPKLRDECRRLQHEIETAENEIERADSQRRLAELTAHLSADLGLKGKARDINKLLEKLRPKIWGRIKTVYQKLREATPPMPNLAKHFEASITSTAEGFLYDPPAPVPRWQVEPGSK